MVAALFLVPVVILVIAVLAFPGILTGEFWRTREVVARPPAAPAKMAKASAPLRTSPDHPAPGAGSKDVLVIDAAPKPQPAAPVAADPDKSMDQAPQPAPTDSAELNKDTSAVEDAQSSPKQLPRRHAVKRLASRHMANEHDTGGFYAMVEGPDGTLRYQYFPSRPDH